MMMMMIYHHILSLFHHFPSFTIWSFTIIYHHLPSFTIIYHHLPSFTIIYTIICPGSCFHHFPWQTVGLPFRVPTGRVKFDSGWAVFRGVNLPTRQPKISAWPTNGTMRKPFCFQAIQNYRSGGFSKILVHSFT